LLSWFIAWLWSDSI